ncbi:MAG: hypothetical protein IAG13_23910, partial [Deltaproteobacteria bacterium]|nr:hypothetical protein [Nannocystaceae bacterium]
VDIVGAGDLKAELGGCGLDEIWRRQIDGSAAAAVAVVGAGRSIGAAGREQQREDGAAHSSFVPRRRGARQATRGGSRDQPQRDGTDDGDGSSGGPVDLPAPDFIEPATPELRLEVTRADDLDLDVSAVEPGRTVLLIDGDSVGALIGDSPVGALSETRLLLHLPGAMVPGYHTLQLLTFDEVATDASEVVEVFLEASVPPVVAWAPIGEVIAVGDALVPPGPGSRAVLGLVDFDAAVPRLIAWPLDTHGWDAAQPRVIPLPELRPDTAFGVAAVAAMRRGTTMSASLRVAWRIGSPGTAIAVVEVPWASAEPGSPVTALVPDASWLGTREWVNVLRPVLAGDLLLTELVAPRDVEQGRPGDRVIASVALAPITAPAQPQLLQLGNFDVDRLGHVVDPLVDAHGDSDTLVARLDHREAIVLDVDRDTRTVRRRSAELGARDERWAGITDPPVMTASAFGSRIGAALVSDRSALLVGLTNDRGGAEPRAVQTQLADAPATAAAALAWIDGVPIVLVPRGAADVIAMPITSDAPELQLLAGLACDAIVGPPITVQGDDRRVTVACLRERELRLVTIRLG